jgi:hypothetical protein
MQTRTTGVLFIILASLFELESSDSCVPAPDHSYFTLGEELPPETFAPLTLVTR